MAMTNFKQVEAKAYNKEEAFEQFPFNVQLQGADCTQAWKNAGKPMTGTALKEFMAEQLQKKTRFSAGNGCYIVVESGVADTRERPYTFENVKTDGKRKFTKVIELINPETNEILAKSYGNKDEAEKVAKALYTDKGYKGNINAVIKHDVTEGEPLAFKVTYTPSKNAKLGTYIGFGVEA